MLKYKQYCAVKKEIEDKNDDLSLLFPEHVIDMTIPKLGMLVLLYFLLDHAGFVIPSFSKHQDKTHLIGVIFILIIITQIYLGFKILSRILKSEFDSDI